MMGFNQSGGFGYGMMGGAGILVLIAGLAALVGLLALVSRRPSRTSSARLDPRRAALDLLDERYARGEIDAREYKARLSDLER